MKALYFNGQLGLRDVERPRPGPDEALVQVSLAGVCGTDLQIIKGYADGNLGLILVNGVPMG